MKKIEVAIVHAFTFEGQGGNPAGVVLNADGLTHNEKLEVASKVKLSETSFVSESDIANVMLEFFTPTKQIPHCGHATVATFSYLRDQGFISDYQNSKETIDGTREVFVDSNKVFMEQKAPKYIPISLEDQQLVIESLGINQTDLADDLDIEIVNTGNSFLTIPLRNEEVIKGLSVDQQMVDQLSRKYDLIGFYPFITSNDSAFDASTRMFAPYYGIEEESATGMAAGPLGGYLYDKAGIKKKELRISQGKYMNSPAPSEILVRLELADDKISKIFAGGSASVIRKLTVEV